MWSLRYAQYLEWHLAGAQYIFDEERKMKDDSPPEPPPRVPTYLPEHEEEPSALSSLGGHICSWALWEPSPGSLWGAISGCPTENPVTGRRMSPSKHPVERGDQRQGSSPPRQPTRGTFPKLLQKGGSLVNLARDSQAPSSLARSQPESLCVE